MKYYPVLAPLILIISLMLAAIGVVAMLAWIEESPNEQKNGFNRRFTSYPYAQLMSVAPKEENVTAACGKAKQHFYFRTNKPQKLWVTDRTLRNARYVTVNFPPNEKVSSAFDCMVDSPLVRIFAGNGPAILVGNLNADDISVYRFPDAAFTRSVAISPKSFVFCGFDPTVKPQRDPVIMKGNPQLGIYQRNDSLLEKHGDGGIQTDGLLSYDRQQGLLTYVHFYSNRFFCLDTNLNLVYTAHTIDTVSTGQVKSGSIRTGERTEAYTSFAPPKIVNRESCISNGLLFVNSRLRADNESLKSFYRNAVIDVYRLKDGRYEGSFYIPDYRGEKLQRYKVFDTLLAVTYNNYVATFRLPWKL